MLYHILSAESLFHALQCNCLEGQYYSGISLTRTKFLNFYVGERAGAFFKLELNQNLLSQDYKLKKTVFVSRTGVSFAGEQETHIDEPIKNLSKYLTKIILIKNKIEDLKNNDWFTTIGVRPINNFKNAPDIINYIYKKYKNIFYIQDGSTIFKDQNYVQNLYNYIKTVFVGYTFYYRGYDKIDYYLKEKAIPVDSYNKNINELVIGYNYYNLRLFKDKDYAMNKFKSIFNLNNKKLFTQNDYKLYVFEFKYIPADIKKDSKEYAIVNKGYLNDIDQINE